jgi:uncharacterized phiE125 gp8 family phage protein
MSESWIEVAPPTELAVSLNQVKDHLQVTDTSRDVYITLLVKAATKVIESKTNRAFIQRSFKFFLDDFEDEIELPFAPLVSITSFKYYDSGGSLLTIPSNGYQIDQRAILPRITHLSYDMWPLANPQYNAIEIEFIAGYGPTSDSVPAEIQAAILFLTAHWFTNREPVIAGTAVLANKIPFTLDYVISSFKIVKI